MENEAIFSAQQQSTNNQNSPKVKVSLRDACIKFFKELTPEAEDFNLEQAITDLSALFAQYPSENALSLRMLDDILGNTHIQILAGALKENQTLISLDLRYNDMGADGAGHISEALKVNQTLISLDLRGNRMRAPGAEHISEALKVNQTLISLDLGENQMGIESKATVTEINDKLALNSLTKTIKKFLYFSAIPGLKGKVNLDVLVKIFRDYFQPGSFPNSTLAPHKVKHLILEFRKKQSNSDYKMEFNKDRTKQQQVNPGLTSVSLLPDVDVTDAVNDGNEVNNNDNNNNNDEGYKKETRSALQ